MLTCQFRIECRYALAGEPWRETGGAETREGALLGMRTMRREGRAGVEWRVVEVIRTMKPREDT